MSIRKLAVMLLFLSTMGLASACTTTSAGYEKEDLLAVTDEKLETYGELEEDGTSYPWINSNEDVESDEGAYTQKSSTKRSASKSSKKKK